MSHLQVSRMVTAGICLALCMVLPFLTGQIPQVGEVLGPMHIPVMLAGFLCGPAWGAVVGAIAPLLRFALFTRPPLFPTGVAMCVELAAYAAVAGLLYRRLPRRPLSVYVSLAAAMLAGRAVWGIVQMALLSASKEPFTWAAFMAGAFTKALPGILLQLILIPAVVLALEKALPWLKHK